MDHTERDVQEIDRLVSNLTSAERSAATSAATPDRTPRSGSRWTNATVRMPTRRRLTIGRQIVQKSEAILDELAHRFEHARSHVPRVHRIVRMPGAVTLVRLWVVLAVAYGGALSFWPYPKTYFWGLVLYQLCLALSLVVGVWAARLCWDARLGAAHTLALGAVLWAMTLGTTNTVTAVRGENGPETPAPTSAVSSAVQRPVVPPQTPLKSNRSRVTSPRRSPASSS